MQINIGIAARAREESALEVGPDRLPPRPTTSFPKVRRLRQLAASLNLFSGVTALAGGAELIAYREGAEWLPPLSILHHTPFRDYLIPGLILSSLVGLPGIVAAAATFRRHPFGNEISAVAASLLVGWIGGEMILLRMAHWLQITYLFIGLLTLGISLWLRHAESTSSAPSDTPLAVRDGKF